MYSPPAAISFSVRCSGMRDAAAFQEVFGLDDLVRTEQITEGGASFKHQMPTPAKHGPILLKRGILPSDHDLFVWCKTVLEGDLGQPISPRDIEIELLDQEGAPIATWHVRRAYPVKWSMGAFDAIKQSIAVEEIFLAHSGIERV